MLATLGRANRAGDLPLLRDYALAVCLDAWKARNDVVSRWRRRTMVVPVPTRLMLPGTTISRTADRGRLVLPREVALGLA